MPIIQYFLPLLHYFNNPDSVFLQLIMLFQANLSDLLTVLKARVGSDQGYLIFGFLFGSKTELSFSVKDNFTILGLFHLLAASGSNVALIPVVLSPFVTFFKSRYSTIFLLTIGFLSYAFLADFSDSILRAVSMALYALLAKQFFLRRSSAWMGIVIAVGILLVTGIVNYDSIGLQLSCAAVTGILLFINMIANKGELAYVENALGTSNLHYSFFSRSEVVSLILNSFYISVSSFLFTAPISAYYFGTFTPASIVANFFVIWFVPVVMLLGILLVVLYFARSIDLINYIFMMLTDVCGWLLDIFLYLVQMAAHSLEWMTITVKIDTYQLITIYLLLISSLYILKFLRNSSGERRVR